MSQEEGHGKAERRGYILIILSVVILDQLSKYLIKTRLGFGSFPLIDNLLYITIVRNTGAAFGMFKDTNFLLTIITVILIVFALRYLLISRGKLLGIALSLIVGGAVGNLIDRIMLGHVVDFIDVNYWPVFNIADSAVSIGIAILIYCIIRKQNHLTQR